MSESKWLPLESSPSVMNKLLQEFGVSEKFQVTDILSLDEEYLTSISSPVHAILLLFPYSGNYRRFRDMLEQRVKDQGQETDPKVFFMRQTIRNSCGTVAMIHSIANNMDRLEFEEGSVIKKFIEKCWPLSPKEKSIVLENEEDIKQAHENCARRIISTSNPSDSERTNSPEKDNDKFEEEQSTDHHYISFVMVNSKLYDLDGYKEFPICHGNTNTNSFLKDAAKVCLEYMTQEPTNLNFTALAFGQSQ